MPGYDTRAEPFFNTKLSMPAVKIPWKKELWHKLVFWQTVEPGEQPVKLDNPLTADQLENNSGKLGKAGGLPGHSHAEIDRFSNAQNRKLS
ncbi:hypothetical protein RRF57_005258 [Xylaria bambusicola]|uniref:Uncharacterized protein n=1 Tax=Xylaria bambusicola TaxID=326684 RepID=A0AAN7Z7R3_9PEZI